MRTLLLRIAIATPITLAALVFPFFLVEWIQKRFDMQIHYVIPLAVGLGLALMSFFSIVGKQMKRVDEEWRKKRDSGN